MMRLLLALGAALSAFSSAVPAATIAITGGTVATAVGDTSIANGTVIIRDGRIVAVGQGLAIPAGATVIDASGKYVTPGLIAGMSNLGITEIEAVNETNDASARTSPFSAAIDVTPAINPLSPPLAINRLGGVTRAVVGPEIAVTITGTAATTSIKIIDARLARASSIITAAKVSLNRLAITADSLELHLRERIPGPGAGPTGPTGPPRGQVVVTGERLRLGTGDPLTFAADITATGPARLLAYDNWATTGTLELASLTLADAHGEIASARATFVPIGRTALRFAGTISTICPANVVAALQGQAAVSEKRLRAPLTLAVEGRSGDMRVTGIPADIATRPTRNQLPPCPVLRR